MAKWENWKKLKQRQFFLILLTVGSTPNLKRLFILTYLKVKKANLILLKNE